MSASIKDFRFSDHVSKQDYAKFCALFERYDTLSLQMFDQVILEYETDLANERKNVEKAREQCAIEIGLIEKGRRKSDKSAEFARIACDRIEALQNTLKESEIASENTVAKITLDLEQMHKIRMTFIEQYPNALLSPRSSQTELATQKPKIPLRLSGKMSLLRSSSQNSMTVSPRRVMSDEEQKSITVSPRRVMADEEQK